MTTLDSGLFVSDCDLKVTIEICITRAKSSIDEIPGLLTDWCFVAEVGEIFALSEPGYLQVASSGEDKVIDPVPNLTWKIEESGLLRIKLCVAATHRDVVVLRIFLLLFS